MIWLGGARATQFHNAKKHLKYCLLWPLVGLYGDGSKADSMPSGKKKTGNIVMCILRHNQLYKFIAIEKKINFRLGQSRPCWPKSPHFTVL